MDTFLWIYQGLLAFIFMFSGVHKAYYPEERLVKSGQTGVAGLHWLLIKSVGLAEIAGALGVIVPWLTQLAPVLTPVAAVGFCLIMLLAAPIHYRRNEPRNVLINIIILVIAAIVAIQRFRML